jgi:hypothetical protein
VSRPSISTATDGIKEGSFPILDSGFHERRVLPGLGNIGTLMPNCRQRSAIAALVLGGCWICRRRQSSRDWWSLCDLIPAIEDRPIPRRMRSGGHAVPRTKDGLAGRLHKGNGRGVALANGPKNPITGVSIGIIRKSALWRLCRVRPNFSGCSPAFGRWMARATPGGSPTVTPAQGRIPRGVAALNRGPATPESGAQDQPGHPPSKRWKNDGAGHRLPLLWGPDGCTHFLTGQP